MEEFLKIFSSAPATAIAWACTVVSCFYAFFQKNNVTKITQKFESLKVQNTNLEQKFESLEVSYNNLKIQNTTLEQKITETENNDIHDNYQEVHQNGETNINQGVIKGDFNFSK